MEELKVIAGILARTTAWCLGSLLLCLRQQVDALIVANTGSTDATAEVAELAGATMLKLGDPTRGAGDGTAGEGIVDLGRPFYELP